MAMTTQDKTNYKNDFNKKNYDRLVLYLRHDDMKRWKDAAGDGSLSSFVKQCVEKQLSET